MSRPSFPSRASASRAPEGAVAGSETARLSATIGVARVLCILGIVYVHAWTGLDGGAIARLNDTPQGLLRWALVELLGRGAVPLLSMIAGWLVAASLARRGWGVLLADKARTILAPMVLWNALALLLVSGAAWAGWIQAPVPTAWWWTIDELLCLATPNDINVQMPFLRDLFVCMVLAPVLVRAPSPVLLAVAGLTLAWSVSGFVFPLLLRPSILLFFLVGMLARRRDLAVPLAARHLAWAGGAYVALAALQVWLRTRGLDAGIDHPVLLASIDLVTRFATALFFWSVAWRLAAGPAAGALLRLEPYAFLMFCSHLIMLWLAGPAIGALTGPMGSPAYPAFLLLQPLLVLAATVLLGRLLTALTPPAARLLSGGRLATPARA